MANRHRVAVIDDDKSVRKGIVSLLRAEGFDAQAFGSAGEFLSAMPEFDPSCVLTDIQMPGMTGIELLEHIRNAGPRLPVMVMTALLDTSLHLQAMTAGAVCCLKKPLDDNELLNELEALLEKGG